MENTQNINLIRSLAMSLLTQEDGIDGKSYAFLRELLEIIKATDIINAVEGTDGSFYVFSDTIAQSDTLNSI